VPLAGTRGTFEGAGFARAKLPGFEPIAPGETRAIRRLSVRAVAVPHDAACPVAFVLAAGTSSLAHATDLGHLSRGLVAELRACDALLVESNYDPRCCATAPTLGRSGADPGPFGHLSNGDVGRLLEKGLSGACRLVVLAHLSAKNNHPELALQAAEEALGRGERRDVRLALAAPEGTGWIAVRAAGAAAGRHEGQLRLF